MIASYLPVGWILSRAFALKRSDIFSPASTAAWYSRSSLSHVTGEKLGLANNPAMAQKVGVRAAHGEAPYQKLVPGKRYKVLLRASGGLTFVPEDLPPDAKPGPRAEAL